MPATQGTLVLADISGYTAGRREFEAILRDRPQVAQGVIRVLCARLAEAQRAA